MYHRQACILICVYYNYRCSPVFMGPHNREHVHWLLEWLPQRTNSKHVIMLLLLLLFTFSPSHILLPWLYSFSVFREKMWECPVGRVSIYIFLHGTHEVSCKPSVKIVALAIVAIILDWNLNEQKNHSLSITIIIILKTKVEEVLTRACTSSWLSRLQSFASLTATALYMHLY